MAVRWCNSGLICSFYYVWYRCGILSYLLKSVPSISDLDNPRLDEKSVMTYVSMLYQCFAKMKHEETGGKRVAKVEHKNVDKCHMVDFCHVLCIIQP